MPDTPKNPADDEAMKAALAQHPRHSPDATEAFEAGWRAAMAEVEKDRADDGLVAQLRKAANEGIVTATDYQTSQPHRMRISLCGKAADEIERLRAGQPDPDILALARSKAPGITAGRGSEVVTRCVCTVTDRFECVQIRYGRSYMPDLDFAEQDLDDREPCECPCHDDYRDEDDEAR